jgi:hypothetical protein
MNASRARVLRWTPRVMGLLFAAFVGIFALDVFDMGLGFWQTLGALLMHLIPTGLLILAVAIGWRWELAGAALFLGFGALYLISFWGQFPWSVYLIMAGPPALISVLFVASWHYGRRLSPRPLGGA